MNSKMGYNSDVANVWQSCKFFTRLTLQTISQEHWSTFTRQRSQVRIPCRPV